MIIMSEIMLIILFKTIYDIAYIFPIKTYAIVLAVICFNSNKAHLGWGLLLLAYIQDCV